MIRAVTRRPMAMSINTVDARQQPVEGGHQVVVRTRPDLDDDQARGRVRDEDGEETVAIAGGLGREGRAGGRQVVQPAAVPGADRQLARVYGKMLRIASRRRPSPPPAGADS